MRTVLMLALAGCVCRAGTYTGPFVPYQWTTAGCVGATCTWTAAGANSGETITATSTNGWFPGGNGGTPFTPALSNQFSVGPATGGTLTVTFSGYGASGYSGALLFGNIHDFFEYSLSAVDTSNQAINVNNWSNLGENLQSTSSTSNCAGGASVMLGSSTVTCPGASTSEVFYVYDTSNPGYANFGQGGTFVLGGLSGVKSVTWKIESSTLAPNGQGSDFILFNMGRDASTPEPSTFAMFGIGGLAAWWGGLRKRVNPPRA